MTDDTPPNPANDAPHAMVIDNNSERDDAHEPGSPARSSKTGWDGKLRVNKAAKPTPVIVNPHVLSDPELSDDDAGPPPEEIEADEDLLEDYEEDVDQIDLIHCRISSIPALRLERFKQLERLSLRQNQISTIEFPEELGEKLTELDLYDNVIAHIKGLDQFVGMENLDLSFNKIKHIKRVNHMKKLKDLYFVQNKISTIENLEGLTELKNLELGANRIRVREDF